VRIVDGVVHQPLRVQHQRAEARIVARDKVFQARVYGKRVRGGDEEAPARFQDAAQLLYVQPRVLEMLDTLDAEDIIEVPVWKRQRMRQVVHAVARSLAQEFLGRDEIETMDIAPPLAQQLGRERAIARGHVEHPSLGPRSIQHAQDGSVEGLVREHGYSGVARQSHL